ncbi:DNA repair protein REV1 [Parasteatoda tepidariorum]|uniref:DNA repair protein REV1 n=1 Tax=Parasteatoda tepidariorum TaxID=114398 RepID=UPI001C721764|nr:DNA repair protein REV1 isoform X1 [Parasteatoda tepidariorum]XP_015925772.2 DNA repair protein REV1 isoform X1 [Parasteatoda tepidariorum]XP_042902775.1 DNA repair protein REV1 isoform X1 [Parasteatoda tepidariorum]XP_042902776.1 DNA repair protein REV1 isoform X1 [Parasteatoda tepidariorum]
MSSSEDDAKSNTKTKKRRKRTNGFEEWGGYMAAKKSKLEAQFQGQQPIELQNEQQSSIFKEVSIFVNGYTNPSADELKRLMRLHGGIYHHYYSHSKTTHIIASNLPSSKIKNLKNEIVVTAAWITDSIKAGKLLPTHDYLLYSPETKDKQRTICFNKLPTKSDNQPVSYVPILNSVDESDTIRENSTKSPIADYSDLDIVTSPPCFENSESSSEEAINKCETSDTILPNVQEKKCAVPSYTVVNTDSTLLQKPDLAMKAGHPDFLSEFYGHSRLHHISTGGQELKRYVQYLIESKKDFSGREKLVRYAEQHAVSLDADPLQDAWNLQENKKQSHVIMHLDMDCFFVSVGLRKHPELKGLPVAVTHSKGKRGKPQDGSDVQYEMSHYSNKHDKLKGLMDVDEEKEYDMPKPKISVHSKDYGSLSEIASCSYEARKAGLRNGMFLGEALRLCPNLKTISYDFESYSEVSRQLYDIVSSYTLDIEAVSVDELYIDCTELLRHTKVSSSMFASVLREEVFEKTKCTASAGLGSNMLLARLATKIGKPNGQYHVLDSDVEEFMKKQKVDDLPGVGYRTSKKFKQRGIVTCGDLQNLSLAKLQQEFGPKTGESIYNKCRGVDNRVVQVQKDRKSVSAEINYGIRFETDEDVNQFINELAVEVQNRLKIINSKGKAITLKLMVRRPNAPIETAKFMGHGVCDNMSKSVALKSATDNSKIIGNECCTLARSLKINPQDYRGVGIQVSKLEPAEKEEAAQNTLRNFFNQKDSSSKSIESRSPKKLEKALKTPEKNTIKHFLSKPKQKLSYDITDYDQLDQSVLNALPEDIKKEVLENCSKLAKNPVVLQSEKAPTSSKCVSTNVSSNKLGQKELKNPTIITGHENKPSTSKQSSLIEIEKKNELPKNQNLIKMLASNNSSSKIKPHKKRVIEFFITWGERENKSLSSKPLKQASLGGAVELDDVRKLLKEWILNTQTPLEEDIEEFRQFLLDSIDQDLSKVSLLLKYFYRLACSHGLMWKEAYLSILSYVQQKMLQNFGAMLSANSDFPA